jgi:hypothetical protein
MAVALLDLATKVLMADQVAAAAGMPPEIV